MGCGKLNSMRNDFLSFVFLIQSALLIVSFTLKVDRVGVLHSPYRLVSRDLVVDSRDIAFLQLSQFKGIID